MRKSYWSIALIFLSSELFGQYFSFLSDRYTAATGEKSQLLNFNLLATKMLFGFLFFLLIALRSWELKEKVESPRSFLLVLKETALPLFVESLRVWTRVLVGILLLILPGLYLMIRYGFVNLIVVLDPDYQKGNVNALNKSKLLINSWSVGTTLVILSLFDMLHTQLFAHFRFEVAENMYENLAWAPLELLIVILSNSIFVNYFYFLLKQNETLSKTADEDIGGKPMAGI